MLSLPRKQRGQSLHHPHMLTEEGQKELANLVPVEHQDRIRRLPKREFFEVMKGRRLANRRTNCFCWTARFQFPNHFRFSAWRLYQVARLMPDASQGFVAANVLSRFSIRGRPTFGIDDGGGAVAWTLTSLPLGTIELCALPNARLRGACLPLELSPAPPAASLAGTPNRGHGPIRCRSPQVLHFGKSIDDKWTIIRRLSTGCDLRSADHPVALVAVGRAIRQQIGPPEPRKFHGLPSPDP